MENDPQGMNVILRLGGWPGRHRPAVPKPAIVGARSQPLSSVRLLRAWEATFDGSLQGAGDEQNVVGTGGRAVNDPLLVGLVDRVSQRFHHALHGNQDVRALPGGRQAEQGGPFDVLSKVTT